ncbi:MAG: cytochrome c biogenesis protein CcsA, partial [Kofleriaceae bacterium]|nr:cytochrome c biogenesis protein CcsA [Kofleriaceae bacterium]
MAVSGFIDSALGAATAGPAFEIPHSPVASLGSICLHVAFVIAAYAAAVGIVGNIKKRQGMVNSAIYALYGLCAVMVMGSALMEYAFITHDYTIKYVYAYSDTAMPLLYKITAYWGGLDGSLMFWVFVLSVFSTIAVVTNRRKHKDMIGYVVGVICVTQVFFLALLIFSKNPFDTFLTEVPLDGKGLNPLLQTYWMAIHPPSLYIGFIAATIPFAFGVAALASGRLDNQWMKSVRVWTFLCWFFLTFGLILGGRWAYEELGWGGYWAWDPV